MSPFDVFLFVCVGLASEAIYVGLLDAAFTDSAERKFLWSRVSLWLIPIYAAAAPTFHYLVPELIDNGVPLLLRLLFYAVGIWIYEFGYGLVLTALLGKAPWYDSYVRHADSFMGLIRWSMGFAWMALGYTFERLTLRLGGG